MIPAASQITAALEDLFVIEDWHNFGADYDRTLTAWRANFEARWPTLASQLRRALPAHVAFLPVGLRGRVPQPPRPALADRAEPAWGARRLSRAALSAGHGLPARQARPIVRAGHRKGSAMKYVLKVLFGISVACGITAHAASDVPASYYAHAGHDDVLGGGVKMIPINTPTGTSTCGPSASATTRS